MMMMYCYMMIMLWMYRYCHDDNVMVIMLLYSPCSALVELTQARIIITDIRVQQTSAGEVVITG